MFGDMRPFQAGAFIAGAAARPRGGSMEVSAVGFEIERGFARSMVGWLQVGLVRGSNGVVCIPAVSGPCGSDGVAWMAMAGGSLFPTGREIPVAPYVGGGVGFASPGAGVEIVHLFRAGIEVIPGPFHVRLELRNDGNGWGAGLGMMF